jgi:DNA primase
VRELLPELIARIAAANDIAEVISAYLPSELIDNAVRFRCHCGKPLQIDLDRQIYKCFGCSHGGSVLHFVMRQEGISLAATIRKLAIRAQIDVPEFE